MIEEGNNKCGYYSQENKPLSRRLFYSEERAFVLGSDLFSPVQSNPEDHLRIFCESMAESIFSAS